MSGTGRDAQRVATRFCHNFGYRRLSKLQVSQGVLIRARPLAATVQDFSQSDAGMLRFAVNIC